MDEAGQKISRRQHAEALVILAALALMAYANSFGAGFPRDNRPLILENVRVHSVTRQHLKEILIHNYAWPSFSSGLYRPLATLSYLLNFAVLANGDQPAGYHWINYLLHVANAFLVYLLALRLARQYWPAWFAAALWALHPVSTEAVTNIVGRPEELAALGVLGALLLYVRGAPENGRRRIPWLAAMMAAAAAAVFSKEGGVMVLGLAALYDFTWRRRPGWDAYLCVALPVAAMLCLRWVVLRHDGPMEIPFVDNPISGAGWLAGRATAVAVIGRYLWLLLWPRTLSSDYSYNQIPLFAWHSMTWQQWAAVAAVAGLLLAMAWCYRRSKTGFFLLGFSALTLLPAANLVVTTGTIMGERLLYLPAVGFACAVSFGIYSLASRLGLRPMAAAVALSAIGLAYGARTYRRNPDWQDDETLFASAAEAAPASFKPHLSLAYIWYAQDPTFLQGDRAISEAETAAAIVDGLPDGKAPAAVPAVLGTIYLARGDSPAPQLGAARAEWYGKALAADLRAEAEDRAFNENHRRRELQRGTPADQIAAAGLPDVYGNLGQAYLRLGDPQKARETFLYQRRLAPAMPQAYADLSAADAALDQPEEAARMLLEAYLLERQQSTLYQLSQLYAKIASGGCAVVRQTEGRSLNQDCAIVRRDLCSAFRDLEQVFRDARLTDDAVRFRDAGRGVQGCQ